MTGYVFTYGVDGFGADIAPAHEEGVYLDYNKAFQHLCELNNESHEEREYTFYEPGYAEDRYPETNIILKRAEEEKDWDAYEEELNKHIITDIEKICDRILDYDVPPFGYYSMEEIEIHE